MTVVGRNQQGTRIAVITDTAIAWVNADIIVSNNGLDIDALKVVNQTHLNALQGDITAGDITTGDFSSSVISIEE